MNEFGNNMLDGINLASFILQLQNSEEDKKYKNSVTDFEKVITKEIDELHKENDAIISILKEIQKKI